MLGRLTPALGRGIQFFPGRDGEWEKEFESAARAGLSHIQWVWDALDNPLTDPEVRARVRMHSRANGIPVRGVDLQFLTQTSIEQVSEQVFERICEAIADIDARVIEPPLLEASTLLTGERVAREERLRGLCAVAKRYGLGVNVEADLAPPDFAAMLSRMSDLSVAYDTGNSAHFGYDAAEEWTSYGRRIANIHIKDRPRGGSTVPLGEGAAPLRFVLEKIKNVNYTGLVTLQAARQAEGREAATIREYCTYIRDIYESI